jgi:hypothetical protein
MIIFINKAQLSSAEHQYEIILATNLKPSLKLQLDGQSKKVAVRVFKLLLNIKVSLPTASRCF